MKNTLISFPRIVFEILAFIFIVPPLLAIQSPGWLAMLLLAFVAFCAWRMPTVNLLITAVLWIWGLIYILVNGAGHMLAPYNTYFPVFYYIGFGVFALYFFMLLRPNKYAKIIKEFSIKLQYTVKKHVPSITFKQHQILQNILPFYVCAAIEHLLIAEGYPDSEVRSIISACNPANNYTNQDFIRWATMERGMAIDELTHQGEDAYSIIADRILRNADICTFDCDSIDDLASDICKIFENDLCKTLRDKIRQPAISKVFQKKLLIALSVIFTICILIAILMVTVPASHQ